MDDSLSAGAGTCSAGKEVVVPLFEKKDLVHNLDFWYWAPDNNPNDTTSPAALYAFSVPSNPLISSLLHSPATSDVVDPRSITFTLPGSPGVTVHVVEDNGNLDFTLTTPDVGDLSGLSFDFTNSKLSTLSVTASNPIALTHAGGVVNLTFGVNGSPISDGFLPVTQNIQSESFILSDKAHNLSINDLHPTGETGTVGVTTNFDEGTLSAVAPYAPMAKPATVTTPEDQSITIPVSALATDLNKGAVLTIDQIGTGVEGAQYGTVKIIDHGAALLYTPTTLDHLVDGVLTNNQDAFQVGVHDSLGGEVTSFVTVNATPVADVPAVNVTVDTQHAATDPINEVRLLITSQTGDHGTVNQGSDYLSDLLLNLTGDTGATILGDTDHLVAPNTPIDSTHPIDLATSNLDTFSDEIDLSMPAGTTLNDNLKVTATAAETEAPTVTATGISNQTIGMTFQHNDTTETFSTLPNQSTGTSFSASQNQFLGINLPLNTSVNLAVATFSSTLDFKAGLTEQFNLHGGTINANLPFDVSVDTTYNATSNALLIHTGDSLLSGASFTTTGPGGNFTLGALVQLTGAISLSGGLIPPGDGFSYSPDATGGAASILPSDTFGGGGVTDSDTTVTHIPFGPDPLAPLGTIDVAWPTLSGTSTAPSGDTITGDAASNNFVQFNLDLLRWAAAVDPINFGPIEGILGPANGDPSSFSIMQAFGNLAANLLQHYALTVNDLAGTLTFTDGAGHTLGTQPITLGQDITVPNAKSLMGPDGHFHIDLSLTPNTSLETQSSIGVNVGGTVNLLNNLPAVVNDVLGSPFTFGGSQQLFSIPVADNTNPVGFNTMHYDFVV
jgi:hypothetical protein